MADGFLNNLSSGLASLGTGISNTLFGGDNRTYDTLGNTITGSLHGGTGLFGNLGDYSSSALGFLNKNKGGISALTSGYGMYMDKKAADRAAKINQQYLDAQTQYQQDQKDKEAQFTNNVNAGLANSGFRV